jgi:hypothetical protein
MLGLHARSRYKNHVALNYKFIELAEQSKN